MKPSRSSEHDEADREIIRLLQELKRFESGYPPELLAARRAAFLVRVDRPVAIDVQEEFSAGDEQILQLLGKVKSAEAAYPPALLAARRSAFLQQLGRAATPSLWDALRSSIQRIFPYKIAIPTAPGIVRTSLVIASLILAVFIGSLFLSTAQTFQPAPSPGAAAPTRLLPTGTGEAAVIICIPDDQTLACPPGELDPARNLADPGNGTARPAVSKDGASRAGFVNDGRSGTSWVSDSPESWIKIDLGQVRTINTVSLQRGSPAPAGTDPGRFVIAVALSDVYSDGDSSNDYLEYAEVLRSDQTGSGSAVAQAQTIRAQFAPVRARYVKITFEKAGTAIEEVGVFMVEPPLPTEQPEDTPTLQLDLPGTTPTSILALTLPPADTTTSVPPATLLPIDTALPNPTNILPPLNTPLPADTPTSLPASTPVPARTITPLPPDPLPSESPLPLPTVVPPTPVPLTPQPSPVSTAPIVVTGNSQTLTFICNGNAVEIRGHVNTITLLGSCSSITVTGNGNRVFWQSGSPVIIDRGRDNLILQQ